jgi:hypothetical protein
MEARRMLRLVEVVRAGVAGGFGGNEGNTLFIAVRDALMQDAGLHEE